MIYGKKHLLKMFVTTNFSMKSKLNHTVLSEKKIDIYFTFK